MKKRLVSVLLCAAMAATMIAGCGSSGGGSSTGEGGTGKETGGDAAEEQGKVLNIYCWNEEFKDPYYRSLCRL